MKHYYHGENGIIFTITLMMVLLMSCILPACTTYERISRQTPEEISRWSDRDLCTYAAHQWNPAIETELIKRNLYTPAELKDLIDNPHQWLHAGMRKCAMWKYAWKGKLQEKTDNQRGVTTERWKLTMGETAFFGLVGGDRYLVTVQNDYITEVIRMK